MTLTIAVFYFGGVVGRRVYKTEQRSYFEEIIPKKERNGVVARLFFRIGSYYTTSACYCALEGRARGRGLDSYDGVRETTNSLPQSNYKNLDKISKRVTSILEMAALLGPGQPPGPGAERSFNRTLVRQDGNGAEQRLKLLLLHVSNLGGTGGDCWDLNP